MEPPRNGGRGSEKLSQQAINQMKIRTMQCISYLYLTGG